MAKELKEVLAPIWDLYSNENVHDIIVDSFDEVYYEEAGQIKDAVNIFDRDKDVKKLIKDMAEFANKKIDKSQCAFHFNLDETTRVTAVLPPLSLKGPAFNIMKLPKQEITWDDYLNFGAVDQEGKDLIQGLLDSKKNILVSGSMNSGKTTLMNMLIENLPAENRVVTLERVVDLVLKRKKTVRLVAPNHKEEEMVDLVQTASKMRADYVVLYEMNGAEVSSYLELLRDGHLGLAMIASENIFDAIKRLELKALGSSLSSSLEDIRYNISQSFSHIVYQEKCEDGKRRITRVAEVTYESGEIKLNVIYKR